MRSLVVETERSRTKPFAPIRVQVKRGLTREAACVAAWKLVPKNIYNRDYRGFKYDPATGEAVFV